MAHAVKDAAPVPRGRLGGIVAALVTVSIWAGWIVATRHAAVSSLGLVDVGLLRYGVPALVLVPVWLRTGLLPRGVPLAMLALMVVGSGAPFFLIASAGMRFAPAAHVGALLPGTMPLWAALISLVLLRERLAGARSFGYALIAAAVAVVVGADLMGSGGAWQGHLLLLTASALWAVYTHAFRRSGLSALQAAALVAAWSAAILAVPALVLGTALSSVPPAELALQASAQGILSGLAAIVAYGISVRRLGAVRASAFSALAPALAALGGLVLLGEALGLVELVSVACAGAGVALAVGPAGGRSRNVTIRPAPDRMPAGSASGGTGC
ncbi:DMT family transporter [Arenibaculum pallidiluteum]|uniref:DMT family transporter n=1 Tax=Arenibaculum pallidiluteum TaxID=2812559 RepID=UPI001A962889|nr:DMT family transporter [Arenibaculum pallidiluteum]